MKQSNSHSLCLDHLSLDRLNLDHLSCVHPILYRLSCFNTHEGKYSNEEADGEHRRRCTSEIHQRPVQQKQCLNHLAGLKPLQRKQRHEEVDGELRGTQNYAKNPIAECQPLTAHREIDSGCLRKKKTFSHTHGHTRTRTKIHSRAHTRTHMSSAFAIICSTHHNWSSHTLR